MLSCILPQPLRFMASIFAALRTSKVSTRRARLVVMKRCSRSGRWDVSVSSKLRRSALRVRTVGSGSWAG